MRCQRLSHLADGWLMHDRRDPGAVRRLRRSGGATACELPIRRSRGYAPLPVALPGAGAADAGRRRGPQEHACGRRPEVRLAEPAHRRHGRPRHVVGLRLRREATRVADRRHPGNRCRGLTSGLPLHRVGAPQCRRAAGPVGPAPSRTHRRGDGRTRAGRGQPRARLRIRRNRLRSRRGDLGRRGPARRLQGLSSALRT